MQVSATRVNCTFRFCFQPYGHVISHPTQSLVFFLLLGVTELLGHASSQGTDLFDAIPNGIDGLFSVVDAHVLHQALGHKEAAHAGALVDQELVQLSQVLFLSSRELDDVVAAVFQQIVNVAVRIGGVLGAGEGGGGGQQKE